MRRYLKADMLRGGEIYCTKKIVKGYCRPHPHDFFEIEYISSGTGNYNVDGVCHEARGGMLFLMTPISFHSVKTDALELYNVMFSEKLCDGQMLAELVLLGSLSVQIKAEDRGFFDALFSELAGAKGDEKYRSFILNSIIGKLRSYSSENKAEGPPIAKGMFYLISNFRNNPTLAETAAYAGFSPTYFSSVFKRETGVSFKEYVDRLRFNYAKKLAETSDISVMEIAAESGFDDYPNFIRRFKARFGCTVSELRKKIYNA